MSINLATLGMFDSPKVGGGAIMYQRKEDEVVRFRISVSSVTSKDKDTNKKIIVTCKD